MQIHILTLLFSFNLPYLNEWNNILWLALFPYFIPSLIAFRTKSFKKICISNLLFGWTIIGWIVTLIWACNARNFFNREKQNIYNIG